MEERRGKVWSLTDEDGESYPCVRFARMKNASSANKREREILISRVYQDGSRSLSRKKRDNRDRGAAKAEKLHGT